ncbi:Peptidase propeptide and YPEB domain-containing protein [Tenacibaculum sp. MAR_2009_124]|uniref:PepSY domain-containing protein n=1 Tax=Tenacibaculum sp. MAR_2009_124 TaxID=1250059 RepID=UPI000898AB66|nr:PepSY domain-containing protein [Tenacibaculum sp. MAR_2009_124]SEB86510.1 Peptidase propeptide and YPEB domain-containing protein [Tenacibaculum sp. MAR_2009_124]
MQKLTTQKLQKTIISLHHWLGTFFSALFLIWFLSGIVMMYQSFPFLSKSEQKSMLPAYHITNLLSPTTIFKEQASDTIYSLSLSHQLKHPVYHLTSHRGKVISKYADNGESININKEKAISIAKENSKITEKGTVHILTELDQWIPRTRFLSHMPIYKVNFENDDRTYVYISSLTGKVLAINTSTERFWSWLGAIPHWIYFKDIRIHNALWYQLIVWISALGFFMVLTGVFTGIVRYKKKPKANFKRFKNKWYNFHYYFGLFFGTFICTWIFSGWMSMTPFSWTPSTSLSKTELKCWQKGSFTLKNIHQEEWNNFLHQISNSEFQEVNFSYFKGSVFSTAYNHKQEILFNLSEPEVIPETEDYIEIIESFPRNNSITKITLLETYDNYYYSRHNTKKLPVLRIDTNTETSYYIDLETTKIIYKCSTKNRIQRWIYHGLHSLDFPFLAWNRPLWDILLIVLLIGGTVVCFTGTVMGVKFLKRKQRKKKHEKRNRKKQTKLKHINSWEKM